LNQSRRLETSWKQGRVNHWKQKQFGRLANNRSEGREFFRADSLRHEAKRTELPNLKTRQIQNIDLPICNGRASIYCFHFCFHIDMKQHGLSQKRKGEKPEKTDFPPLLVSVIVD
jgi:hypothetical protein